MACSGVVARSKASVVFTLYAGSTPRANLRLPITPLSTPQGLGAFDLCFKLCQ